MSDGQDITHDSATDAPRHPTSVAPGEAAGDGLDEPLGEGLGERLEWIVDIHANRIAGRADVGRWWDGLSDYARRKHLGCAVRELDGQRHALLEERKALLSSWWRAMEAAGIQVHESLLDAVRGMRDERDAALADVERLRADVVAASGELLVDLPEPGTDMARVLIANRIMRRERDEALEASRENSIAEAAAIERAERADARVRELEAIVYAQIPPCSPDADPTPDPFDAWHARECRGLVEIMNPCDGSLRWSGRAVGPYKKSRRFRNRTCREVYAAEVLGRGGEEGVR